jgi:hypothetical protein
MHYCSRVPCLLPDVDNPQNQQKITAVPIDFVFHNSVDKILTVFAARGTPRSVDKSVDNFTHVVHNLLSHWQTNEFQSAASRQSFRRRSGACCLERMPRSHQ